MAFVIEQRFEDTKYDYDREGDVLYISFGLPRPAVVLGVEDWLLVRVSPSPPHLCGLTIVGFKNVFSRVRPDLVHELPERMERLKAARFVARYSDETDTLAFRLEEEQPSYYERFSDNIYLERSLVAGDIVGFKITQYTAQGQAAVDQLLSSIIDTLFSPAGTVQGPADELARAVLERVDLGRLLSAAA